MPLHLTTPTPSPHPRITVCQHCVQHPGRHVQSPFFPFTAQSNNELASLLRPQPPSSTRHTPPLLSPILHAFLVHVHQRLQVESPSSYSTPACDTTNNTRCTLHRRHRLVRLVRENGCHESETARQGTRGSCVVGRGGWRYVAIPKCDQNVARQGSGMATYEEQRILVGCHRRRAA